MFIIKIYKKGSYPSISQSMVEERKGATPQPQDEEDIFLEIVQSMNVLTAKVNSITDKDMVNRAKKRVYDMNLLEPELLNKCIAI